MKKYPYFNAHDIHIINHSVAMAEELVCEHYKLSDTQWLQLNYDVKTLADLAENEIVEKHFAQVIRYGETRKRNLSSTPVKDFYKVCLQDHAIMDALQEHPNLDLYAFGLYIVCHELIHIVRFRKFLQHFDAPPNAKMDEEFRVHAKTREILSKVNIKELGPVLAFYKSWFRFSSDSQKKF